MPGVAAVVGSVYAVAYRTNIDRTVPARNGVDLKVVNEAADLAVVPGVAVGAGDVNAFATGGVEVIAIGFDYEEGRVYVVDNLPVGADGGVGRSW